MNNPNEPSFIPPIEPFSSSQPPPQRRRRFHLSKLISILATIAIIFAAGFFIGSRQANTAITSPVTNAHIPASNSENATTAREQVIAQVKPSVVEIKVSNDSGGSGLGSGVVIDSKGYIITNNHVIEGAQNISVVFANGTTVPGTVAGAAPTDDLAVVKIDPTKTKLTVITIGDSSKAQVGQDVLVIGNPLGITQTVTAGIISALDRNVSEGGPNGNVLPQTIQTDAAINPGNSGGALVNLQGELIGIPTLTAIDPEFKTPANGVGFAIPSNRVKFIAPQLIQFGRVQNTGRAALGIAGISVDAVLQKQNNLPTDHGVLIVSAIPNGPAAKAGLQPNDIIVQIDNAPVTNLSSLSDIIISKQPGDTVTVQFYRGQQQQSVKVQLGELAAG